jgi:hypothetical protein
MKSFFLSSLFLFSIALQAKETIVCTEVLPVSGFEVLRSQKVITIKTLGEATDSEIKKAQSSGELDVDQDVIEEEIDYVRKVNVKIEEVIGDYRTTIEEVQTFSLEADVAFWITSTQATDFDFHVYLDEMEVAGLAIWNDDAEEFDQFKLSCEYAK